MRRWMISAVVLVAGTSASLSAELKVTSKMSVRAVPGAPAATDMMSQMMGPMMLQMFGGTDGVELVTTSHEDGRTRVEYRGAFAGMPAGTIMLMKADGTAVGYDPKAGTWWKVPGLADMPPEAAAMMAQMAPQVSTKKTGQFETIAGLRAERVSMTMRMAIPLPPEASQMPPELLAMIPKEFVFEGDSWITAQFSKYMKAASKAASSGPLAQFGFEKMMNEFGGISVKQVMRMNLLAGYEMETIVLTAAEEDIADSVFDLPAGLKEVPMPTPSIR